MEKFLLFLGWVLVFGFWFHQVVWSGNIEAWSFEAITLLGLSIALAGIREVLERLGR